MDDSLMRELSLNISGLKNPLKRRCIYNMLKRELIDIICLQETHLWKTEEKYSRELFKGHIYHASAQVKKEGFCLGSPRD